MFGLTVKLWDSLKKFKSYVVKKLGAAFSTKFSELPSGK